MIPRPDLLDARSPAAIEVFQLTDEPDVPSSHVYMEAQVFTPDSRRLLLHRSAHPHGSDQHDPRHRYLVCDLTDACRLAPITHEIGATAPSLSPDGSALYYLVNETEPGGGRLTLKRVALDGTGRETLLVLDAPFPGTDYFPSQLYPLSTISSDGARFATSTFLGGPKVAGAPFGLLVFDLETATVELVLVGETWSNMHPQYCRARDPAHARDIMIQEGHGLRFLRAGHLAQEDDHLGVDIHLIRDDGTDFRNLPWGRDGNEFCQGHQCWIGRSERAITSTGTRRPQECQLIAGRAVPYAGHVGLHSPGGVRTDLSRTFAKPDFYHFATDIAGARFITDSGPSDHGGCLYYAHLPAEEDAPIPEFIYLLNPRNSWQKGTHIHPFLSPDGATGFFNSDESDTLQAYMIAGLGRL